LKRLLEKVSKNINFDNFVGTYEALLQADTKFFSGESDYFASYKVAILKNELKIVNPKKILEPGCGVGRNLAFLKRSYPDASIIGTDISKKSINYAAENIEGVKCLVEDFCTHKINGFDLIFVAGVYHHIELEFRMEFTKLCYERLNNGGSMVIFEHNPLNFITRFIVSRCPYDVGVRLVGLAQLVKHLESAGFTIKRKGYCLFIPQFAKSFRGCERYLKWIPLGGQYYVEVIK